MKFTCISDTHQKHGQIKVPDTDMVIHSGDINAGSLPKLETFLDWFAGLPHKHKVFIAGNHDWVFQNKPKEARELCEKYKDRGVIYLQDESIEIDGIKIWGSPQTPEFFNWAFNCWRTEQEAEWNDIYHGGYHWIGKFWKMIPEDTDILVTHGPPYGILDFCASGHVGCEELKKTIEKINPRYSVFGHIHEGRGVSGGQFTTFINASSLDGGYEPYLMPASIHEIKEK